MEGSTTEDPESKKLEGGISLIRTGEEATLLRHRLERPARVGRYVMGTLGAITAAAGVATWITTASEVGLVLGAFGGVLTVLSVAQHLLYRRDLDHWPTDVLLWDEGVELVLHNGEVRGATWSDPGLALHLVERRAPPPANREYLLVWLMDPKIPPVELSAEGFDRLNRATVDRHLRVNENRRGSRPDATRLIEIRQGPAGPTPDAVSVAANHNPE